MTDPATPSGTPLKLLEKRGGSFLQGGEPKKPRSSINSSVQTKPNVSHVARLRWTELMAAVGDQGARRDDVDALKHLFFPRPLPDREVSGGSLTLEAHPNWHHQLVREVMEHETWKNAEEEFGNAREEADLYEPLRNILHLISTLTQHTPEAKAGTQTTRLTWLCTPEIPLILPPETESPPAKPDLVGVFGNSAAEPGKLMDWTVSPETWHGRIEAIDVLIPIEVGFTKAVSVAPDQEQVEASTTNIAKMPSSSVSLQAGDVTMDGDTELRYDPNPRRVRPGPIPRGSGKPKSIPNLFDQTPASYFGKPMGKASIMIGYLATLREVQVFRTGALGIIVQNTQFTIVYSTLAGTLMTYPIEIFADARLFISTIIHLTVGDYIMHGFDSIWVHNERVYDIDPYVLARADPRTGRGRRITLRENTYIVDKCLLHRFTIHGRGTTVITVRLADHEPNGVRVLKVLKYGGSQRKELFYNVHTVFRDMSTILETRQVILETRQVILETRPLGSFLGATHIHFIHFSERHVTQFFREY